MRVPFSECRGGQSKGQRAFPSFVIEQGGSQAGCAPYSGDGAIIASDLETQLPFLTGFAQGLFCLPLMRDAGGQTWQQWFICLLTCARARVSWNARPQNTKALVRRCIRETFAFAIDGPLFPVPVDEQCSAWRTWSRTWSITGSCAGSMLRRLVGNASPAGQKVKFHSLKSTTLSRAAKRGLSDLSAEPKFPPCVPPHTSHHWPPHEQDPRRARLSLAADGSSWANYWHLGAVPEAATRWDAATHAYSIDPAYQDNRRIMPYDSACIRAIPARGPRRCPKCRGASKGRS